MSNLLVYLGQVSVGSILLYGCFVVFYRKETFYPRNRIMLLLSMLLPMAAPLINISGFFENSVEGSVGDTIYRVVALNGNTDQLRQANVGSFNFSSLLFWIWLTVASILLISTAIAIIRTFSIVHNGTPVAVSKWKTVVTEQDFPPFSFWSVIVLPRTIYENGGYDGIIDHESAHLEQKHTIDLIVCEIFKAVFWFNPVAWMIKKSVILNHEYLADSAIVHKSADIKQYQYSLLNIQPSLFNISIVHNFSNNIKNRIVMMNKKPTRGSAAWKNLLVIPMVMFLLLAFSFKTSPGDGTNSVQQTSISKDSQIKILISVGRTANYPQEARESGTIGKVYAIVSIDKKGEVKSITAKDGSKDPGVPIVLDEVVVVGYGKTNVTNNDLTLLKTEAINACRLIDGLDIPEFKTGDIKFAIPVSFKLEDR